MQRIFNAHESASDDSSGLSKIQERVFWEKCKKLFLTKHFNTQGQSRTFNKLGVVQDRGPDMTASAFKVHPQSNTSELFSLSKAS